MSAFAIRDLARAAAAGGDVEGFLAENRNRIAPETIVALKEEVDRLSSVDLARAERLADATHLAARSLGDPVSLGFGEAAIARVRHIVGRTGEAAEHYRAAIGNLRLSRRVEAAALEMQLVAVLMRLGRASEGLEVARHARRALRRAGDERLLAQLDTNVGNLHYYVREAYPKALTYLDRARAAFEALGDTRSLAFVEYNRANVLVELDRPREALELFDRARRLLAAEGLERAAAQVSFTSAQTLAQLGRYREALRRFYAARERFAELGDGLHAAWSGLALAELSLTLNNVDEAADLATATLAELSSVEGHEAEVARARIALGEVLTRRRDLTGAARELAEAQAIFDRLAMPVLGAGVRVARAGLALARGHADEAAELAAEAARIYGAARLPAKRGRARLVEAEAARALGAEGRALRLARSVLPVAARTGDPWLAWRAELLLGEVELSRGRREEGVLALERAIVGIERLRSRLGPGQARASFLGDKLAPYERLVALNLERGDAAGLRAAFRYIQMAKSRALAELMGTYLDERRGLGAPVRQTRLHDDFARRLEELTWYNARLEHSSEKDGRRGRRGERRLRDEMRRCEYELDVAFRRMEAERSLPAMDAGFEPADVDDLARDLADDEALVEFFAVQGRLCAFVVTADGAASHFWLAERGRVDRMLSGLRFQLAKFAHDERYTRAHRTTLRRSVDTHLEALYSEILAPIAGAIEGRRLLFAPHGTLHYVPLHALRRPDGRYLIETNEVSYCPSATLFRACARRGPSAADVDLLAVGVTDERTPFIRDELLALRRLFPSASLLEGAGAGKTDFLDRAPRSRVLHIATHGSFRPDNPMFSSVRLADASLSFYDLFDLPLDAELVTLSACSTGVNELAPGDELCGLMRGFLYAGAPSLVVSLWAVHDRSTCEIMERFYGELAAGNDKRVALRRASLEALDRYGHPYYWAPFVLMGNHGTLSQRSSRG
jgi:CHAT domain-containing protein/tetratricopeptide (TPR) repeat protein